MKPRVFFQTFDGCNRSNRGPENQQDLKSTVQDGVDNAVGKVNPSKFLICMNNKGLGNKPINPEIAGKNNIISKICNDLGLPPETKIHIPPEMIENIPDPNKVNFTLNKAGEIEGRNIQGGQLLVRFDLNIIQPQELQYNESGNFSPYTKQNQQPRSPSTSSEQAKNNTEIGAQNADKLFVELQRGKLPLKINLITALMLHPPKGDIILPVVSLTRYGINDIQMKFTDSLRTIASIKPKDLLNALKNLS